MTWFPVLKCTAEGFGYANFDFSFPRLTWACGRRKIFSLFVPGWSPGSPGHQLFSSLSFCFCPGLIDNWPSYSQSCAYTLEGPGVKSLAFLSNLRGEVVLGEALVPVFLLLNQIVWHIYFCCFALLLFLCFHGVGGIGTTLLLIGVDVGRMMLASNLLRECDLAGLRVNYGFPSAVFHVLIDPSAGLGLLTFLTVSVCTKNGPWVPPLWVIGRWRVRCSLSDEARLEHHRARGRSWLHWAADRFQWSLYRQDDSGLEWPQA